MKIKKIHVAKWGTPKKYLKKKFMRIVPNSLSILGKLSSKQTRFGKTQFSGALVQKDPDSRRPVLNRIIF